MTKKATTADQAKGDGVTHPGMMGDGTQEQSLNERGNPAARITEAEVAAAFKKPQQEK